MFNPISIIERNNATFYDFRTEKRRSIAVRISATAMVSACLALVSYSDLDNLLLGLITLQSILVGFSFNVMFYLVNSKFILEETDYSIEKKLTFEKLTRLSKELFHNLAYFNLVATSSLILALMLLAPEPLRFETPAQFSQVADVYSVIYVAGCFCVRAVLYFTIAESLYTFVRTVGRVNYLFEQKIA